MAIKIQLNQMENLEKNVFNNRLLMAWTGLDIVVWFSNNCADIDVANNSAQAQVIIC